MEKKQIFCGKFYQSKKKKINTVHVPGNSVLNWKEGPENTGYSEDFRFWKHAPVSDIC